MPLGSRVESTGGTTGFTRELLSLRAGANGEEERRRLRGQDRRSFSKNAKSSGQRGRSDAGGQME
jgi:hypothetical protein